MRHYIDKHIYPKLNADLVHDLLNGLTARNDAYDGLGIIERDDPQFIRIKDYLYSQIKAWHADFLKVHAGPELLNLVPNDYDRFLGNLIVLNHCPEQRYLHQPILHTIDPKGFVNKWFSLPILEQNYLVSKLGKRYAHYSDNLTEEGPWWELVWKELGNRMKSEQSIPRKVQIKLHAEYLKQQIDQNWGVNTSDASNSTS